MVAYVEAVGRLGWLMDALKTKLERLPDRAEVNTHIVREASRRRRATVDEASVALEALVELGVLVHTPGGLVLNRSTLEQMASYRAGVRDGLALGHTDAPHVALCTTSLPGPAIEVETAFRQYASDLRGVIVDLVAGARKNLVMASPFWDRPTFHFKAAIANGGARAYLGTANFTKSGLRLRLDLGVLLEGETARRLSDIIYLVLALARPVSLGVNPWTH